MPMKYQFLKSVVVLGTMLALVNCGEDAAEAINNLDLDPSAVQPTEDTPNVEVAADSSCWLLNADQPYLIRQESSPMSTAPLSEHSSLMARLPGQSSQSTGKPFS